MKTKLIRPRLGFTLVELLVVIGVIVVLVALIFPISRRFLEISNKNACLTNMKRVGQLITVYAADNGGNLLPTLQFYSASRTSGNRAWFHYLVESDYLPKELWVDKRNGVMTCPSRVTLPLLEKDEKKFFDGVHFGMNIYPGFDNTIIPGQAMYKMSNIARPSKTLLLGESDGRYAVYPKMTNRRLMVYPHDNGCNLFFADGHSEYAKKDLPEPTDEESYPFY